MKTVPIYSKNTPDSNHFEALKKLVYNSRNGFPKGKLLLLQLKAFLLPIFFFAVYITALQVKYIAAFYLLYAALGIILVIIFLNIVHEACHNTLFKSKRLNSLFASLLDVLGANSFIWKARHTKLHHNYPNVLGWDSDIEKSGLLKIHPHVKTKKLHTYQHKYFLLLYPTIVASWLFARDFKDFFFKTRLVRKVVSIPAKEYIKLFFFKSLFFFYILAVPFLFFNRTFLECLLAFAIMLFVASILALLVLLTPHVNDTNEFPKVEDENQLSNSWFMHQLVTTNDVTTSNCLTKFLMANFNFHIAHHLFPNISFVYAPEVTKIIKNYTDEHDLPYRSYSLTTALKYHYRLIKSNSVTIDLFEEDM